MHFELWKHTGLCHSKEQDDWALEQVLMDLLNLYSLPKIQQGWPVTLPK